MPLSLPLYADAAASAIYALLLLAYARFRLMLLLPLRVLLDALPCYALHSRCYAMMMARTAPCCRYAADDASAIAACCHEMPLRCC